MDISHSSTTSVVITTTGSNIPVPQKSFDVEVYRLPYFTSADAFPSVTLPAIASSNSISAAPSSSCTALSPLTPAWNPQPASNCGQLYPPGRNSEGLEYSVSDEAWVALEFGSCKDEEFDVPADAVPDLEQNVFLKSNKILLKSGKCFVDKILPRCSSSIELNQEYPSSYFIDLHNKVRQSGTYNFAGARIELQHNKIKVDVLREMLAGYDDIEVCQFLQYGFPLGLAQEIFLDQSLKNHQSAFTYFSFVDALIVKELNQCGITGPFQTEPFAPTMISPMMTSPKNPGSRRPVFDASYGDWSINENTPQKSYLGGTYSFSFPTTLDFADLVRKQGKGCLMYKRDLSRWFLQLPVDPADYDKLGFVWRGQLWLWVAFVWGKRHAGYNGQRVASAILHIFQKLGLNKFQEGYNVMVYMDDYGGCEQGGKSLCCF